jgi:PPP family 3-phenylpropionic acid transporter
MKFIINIKKEMAAVIAIMGLGTLAMSILGPMMPLYLTSIGVGPATVGLMLSVAMVGMAIGETSWGWLADRAGLQLAMNTGTFLCGLSVLLFIFTRNYAAIFAIFFLWGFVRSALFGPSRGYIGAAAPRLKKATYMAITAVMLAASRSLGALPSGFMVESWGYHSVFIASCGVSLLGGLLVVTMLRKSRRVPAGGQQTDTAPTGESADTDQKINYFSLTPQCVVTALRFLGLGSTMTFLPLLATQVVGVDTAGVGVLFTINGLVNVVLGIPAGIIADHAGKKTIMIIGLLVSAGSLLGIAWSSSFAWLIFFNITNSIGAVLFSPAALGLLSESVPARKQSTAMGFYGGVCENIGIVAGSALGGVIWDAFGPRPTFIMSTVSCVIAAILCSTLVKDRPRS